MPQPPFPDDALSVNFILFLFPGESKHFRAGEKEKTGPKAGRR
jgi:hypothetical protein